MVWDEIEAQLTALLYNDELYYTRPFSRIREHPCWAPILIQLRENKDEAVARLIGYLESFDVLGQWSLILLPVLTGENPVPEFHRDELMLELTDWTAWAKRAGIEPILNF